MLNRRHLRIKVLQVLYAYFQSEGADFKVVEKELMNSIERIYDIYLDKQVTSSDIFLFLQN